jgi:hypothetical protein
MVQENQAWLRDGLAAACPDWDAAVTEGVAAALASAGDQAQVDGLVRDFIGDNIAARRLVAQFRADTAAPAAASEAAPQQRPQRPPPPPQQQQQPAAPSDADLRAAFDMGVNVRTTVKRAPRAAPAAAPPPALQRKVVNCLACGRVFDCRRPAGDALRFLAAGGVCTFCGARVHLTYTDGSTNAAAAGAACAPPPASAASEEASALRDRLVEFDREAARRTVVLDDQSDFFSVDANAWLTDEERAELKARERQAAEAAEERRRRVTVTVDLLGRRVVLEAGAGAGEGEGGAAAAASAAAEAEAEAEAEAAQGGGAAAREAAAAAAGEARAQRISVNPSMAKNNYTFLPPAAAAVRGRGRAGRALLVAAGPPRVQHDGERENGTGWWCRAGYEFLRLDSSGLASRPPSPLCSCWCRPV